MRPRLSLRRARPLVDVGPWSGGALTDDGSPQGDTVHGWAFALQWLGLMIEIGVGSVRGPDRS